MNANLSAITYFNSFNEFSAVILSLSLVFWLASYYKLRKSKTKLQIANDIVGQLGSCGWASLTITKSDHKALFCNYLENIIGEDASKIKQLDDFMSFLHPEDCVKLRFDMLNKRREQSIIRLKTGNRVQYFIAPTKWKKLDAFVIIMRDVHREYQKMISAISENESLKHEKTMNNLLLNNIPIPMWIRDSNLNITYCNLSYMQMVEENDADIADGFMPSLFKGAKRIASDAINNKNNASSRHRLVVDGNRLLWQINEQYVSEINGTIGFAQDISELEKAEHEITNNLSTLEDLLDSSSSAMIIYGADMRLKFYNQAYVRIWGVDEAWLDSEPTFPEMIERLRELRRLPEQINFQAFKQNRIKLFHEITEPQEELFYLPDGRTLRTVAIPNSAGGMLSIYEDVTDRLALERSYNTLIAVQRETLDNLHEGVVVFGEDGKLKLKNPTFLSLWDLDEKDLSHGMHISQLIDKTKHLYASNNWDIFKEEWIGLAQDRQRHSLRFERTDGAVLDCSIVPLPDGGVLINYIDNTAATLVERSLRERNEALEAGDKLKTEFLANMSYELRSPLTSISGFAEMLRQNYFGELSEKQREYVEGIHNSSQHLMHLIDDILDLSSIEAGYMTLKISEFNIYKLLNTMTRLLSERLREFDLIAHIECDENIGNMMADESRIRQILFHLLSNAVKYSTDSAGSITIGARKGNEDVIFWVKDNGVGISEVEQKEVFDKFYRGSSGIRKPGTGLGLSMVKSFVELHGGYVELKSELGSGTIVTCHLPQNAEKPLIKLNASKKHSFFAEHLFEKTASQQNNITDSSILDELADDDELEWGDNLPTIH